MSMLSNWKEIWDKKASSGGGVFSLQDLINIDGFDSGAGRIEVGDWARYVEFIYQKLNISGGESIFEVGCGAGAFIYLLYKKGHKVGGIDCSEKLICVARTVMSNMEFNSCEASALDVSKKYDYVISNSVFHYFPDLKYSQEVLNKMLEKARNAIAVLDVPDLDLKEESENARREAMPPSEYNIKYNGLRHLYYSKGWFNDIGRKSGCKVEVFDQNIKNYGNSKYRFNVIMRKDG